MSVYFNFFALFKKSKIQCLNGLKSAKYYFNPNFGIFCIFLV